MNKINSFNNVYYNSEYRQKFKKNDCPEDMGTTEEYVVPEAQFVSTVSQADADAKAKQDAEENGQRFANIVGGCCFIYYNERQEGDFYKNDCSEDMRQETPTHYVIEAKTVYSKESVEDANRLAREKLAVEGQAEANLRGECKPIYWNERQYGWYKKRCQEGWESIERYKVMDAHTVYSFVSVEDANRLAKEKLDKEAQQWVEENEKCNPKVACETFWS